MLTPFLWGLLLATGVGLMVGLEREFNTQSEEAHFAGIRTFPTVAILGYLAGFLAIKGLSWVVPATVAGMFLLLTVTYFVQTQKGNHGLTTEFALLTIFVLGIYMAYGYIQEGLAVAVIMTTLLSLKSQFRQLISQITQEEMFAFIKFILLALLLLPQLPNESFGPDNLLNYRSIGWVVVIVSSLGFAGYLLLKFVGLKRGILLTAVVGGLFSSTMIAWVFSSRSRENPEHVNTYGAGIILSSSIMLGRVLFMSSLFSTAVALQLIVPCCIMLIACLLTVWWLLRKETNSAQGTAQVSLGNPLDISNAVFFGLLYIGISLTLYYSRLWFGAQGAYATGALSGVADIDAITISTAQWASQPDRIAQASQVIMIAMLSNTIFKGVMAGIRGDRRLRKPLALGFGSMLLAGLIWLAITAL